MDVISTDKAPAAIGPYSQAVRSGDFLFCSGQIGIDIRTSKLSGPDIQSQTTQVLRNIKEVLASAGLGLNNVVKTTIFLANMDDFPAVNAVYAKAFGDHRPARATVEIARLPLGALIEIDCIAALKE